MSKNRPTGRLLTSTSYSITLTVLMTASVTEITSIKQSQKKYAGVNNIKLIFYLTGR